MSALARIAEEIFPFAAYASNATKLRALAVADDLLAQKPELARYRELTAEQLLERLKEERARAVALDEKTFKITLSLTVGLTVIGTTAAVLVGVVVAPFLKVALAIAISIAVAFILGAGFLAIGALKTQPSFGYGTELLLVDADKRVSVFAEHLARQEVMNRMRHVRNEASYQALRNGLVLLLLAIMGAALARGAGV